jgi:hypothetical protein
VNPVVSDPWLTVYAGDCRDVLATLPAKSIHAVVTSPPYFGLRDYGLPATSWADGWQGSLGLEPTVDQYVAHIVEVFDAVWRVLRDDGTLWLNLGDSFAGSWGSQGHRSGSKKISRNSIENHPKRASLTGSIRAAGVKPKDLYGLPWRVAFALQERGWYLRRDIVWDKPNPMPESVRDRPTSSHEYVFLLTKGERYFYDADAIAEPAVTAAEARFDNGRNGHGGGESHAGQGSSTRKFAAPRPAGWSDEERHDLIGDGRYPMPEGGPRRELEQPMKLSVFRNARSVWRIATKPYRDIPAGAPAALHPGRHVREGRLSGVRRSLATGAGA